MFCTFHMGLNYFGCLCSLRETRVTTTFSGLFRRRWFKVICSHASKKMWYSFSCSKMLSAAYPIFVSAPMYNSHMVHERSFKWKFMYQVGPEYKYNTSWWVNISIISHRFHITVLGRIIGVKFLKLKTLLQRKGGQLWESVIWPLTKFCCVQMS